MVKFPFRDSYQTYPSGCNKLAWAHIGPYQNQVFLLVVKPGLITTFHHNCLCPITLAIKKLFAWYLSQKFPHSHWAPFRVRLMDPLPFRRSNLVLAFRRLYVQMVFFMGSVFISITVITNRKFYNNGQWLSYRFDTINYFKIYSLPSIHGFYCPHNPYGCSLSPD